MQDFVLDKLHCSITINSNGMTAHLGEDWTGAGQRFSLNRLDSLPLDYSDHNVEPPCPSHVPPPNFTGSMPQQYLQVQLTCIAVPAVATCLFTTWKQ